MTVIKHIICELTGYRPGAVDVSQGDRRSRAVSCRLLENGAPWMIPEGATVRVAYTLPDGTEGLYDALSDGSPAGEIVGNIVTVELADQLMAQKGMAQASILVIGPEGGQIATWPIRVMVSANSAARLTVPENMPPYGAGFAGKIFFGGADGTVTPLDLGDGVEIVRQEDGSYLLVAVGGTDGIQEEADPTVPAWAKQPEKPVYTAEEVGALPAGTKIPAKTSDLSNDAGFITRAVSDLANYYTKTQVEDLIAQIPKFRVSVVQQLPAAGEERVLYLVPFATAEGQYLEYIWVGGRFEVIGSQRVDLSGYATETWVSNELSAKISIADIVDDLVTDVADKPLSARMGVILKNLIDLTDTRLVTEMGRRVLKTELPGAVAGQIQAFEQSKDLELITTFKLTEAVSSLVIDKDSNGQTFELETALFALRTGVNGACGEGTSGAVGIMFYGRKNVLLVYPYSTTGFAYQGTPTGSGEYKNTGITAYATVRNKLGVADMRVGQDGATATPNGSVRNYVFADSPITKITVNSKFPANAEIRVYGVRSGNNA